MYIRQVRQTGTKPTVGTAVQLDEAAAGAAKGSEPRDRGRFLTIQRWLQAERAYGFDRILLHDEKLVSTLLLSGIVWCHHAIELVDAVVQWRVRPIDSDG